MEQWWGDEKVQENKGIAGGRIGRKFSAQLFLFFHALADGINIAALRNFHFCNLVSIPSI
jgi:hypothetical protein